MTIDISPETIQKLEHTIPEIRTRAIENVQSKFQSCRTDLQDLTVDVHDLIKRLLKWFDFKPVTNVRQILEIFLTLLKSKYSIEVARVLNRVNKRGELHKITAYTNEQMSKAYFDEIIKILSNNRVEIFNHPDDAKLNSPKTVDPMNLSDPWNLKEINLKSYNVDGLQFETAWNVLEHKELQALSTLKASLSVKHDSAELAHSLQYFQQYILDFPGEFFLQTPFIFMNLLQLIDCETPNFDYNPALTTCLKLTQNLARRVVVRRVPSMSFSIKEHVKKQQVTIGSYCFRTFQSVLNLLRNIYADSNLASINECFLILIELIDLICKSAGVYSPQAEAEYHIDQIIADLSDFLRFIREITCNFRRNGHKTNRNNSISIIFLLCQLLIFKENRKIVEIGNVSLRFSPKPNESTIDLDISQKIRNFSLRDRPEFMEDLEKLGSSSNTLDDTTSMSTASNYVTAIENADNSTWKRELDIALLDFPLRHFYPEVYELIAYALKIDALPEKSPLKLLMNLSERLEPVVSLLKDPKMCSYEQILSNGLKAIGVLTLVKSDELVHLLFNAITNLTPQYNNSDQLRKNAENLLLHMMSFRCLDMKRLIYKLCADKMSFYVGCIMDKKYAVPKMYGATLNQSCLFGLPLTPDILAEVLCNGLLNEDPKIMQYADTILLHVLRVKNLLPRCWNDMCKFLTPILPLFVCHAKSTTKLGRSIHELVEPSCENVWPTILLIKSNVALLFSRDSHVQSEALYRIIFLLQNVPNADLYIPSLNCISDVIPSFVCVVEEPLLYSNNEDFCDLYEIHLVKDFVNVLQNPHTEPSIRHSTLTQLNMVLEDPIALNRFYEIDGHSTILDALDKSLRDISTDNYAYNAIQIVSILSKMCLRIPVFRRRLEDDIQTYVLILRALMLFHTDDKFKRDCAVLLFTLTFSGYIVGNKKLTLPPVCKRLSLPLVCDFNWSSAFEQQDLVDAIISNESPRHKHPTGNSDQSTISSEMPSDEKNQQIWRYIRMTFGALWFGSLDQLVECTNFLEGSKNTELNYKSNPDSLTFCRALCVTSSDLETIEGTSQRRGLNYWIKFMKSATTSGQVALGCAAIENFSNVDSTGHRKEWNIELFLSSIRRFCTIMPNGKQEEVLFLKMCRLLANLIDRDFDDLHIAILKELRQKNSIYIDMITNKNTPRRIFLCNIRFIEAVLTKTIDSESKKRIEQYIYIDNSKASSQSTQKGNKTRSKSTRTVYEMIFDIALERLDGLLSEKKFDEIRVLVSLIRLVSSSWKIVSTEYTAAYACKKLLKLVGAVTSRSYIGANITKNCLLAIGNIMICEDELDIDKRYITLLSADLCSHPDFEIRTYSWSILLGIASKLAGAENLVQEMTLLPGGFFACCLNTLLDDMESAMVRENAALVFATLISNRKSNNELNDKLYPKNVTENGSGSECIGLLLYHHGLIRKIMDSTKHVYMNEMIEIDRVASDDRIVPCNLMRAYCIILSNLIPLKGAGDINEIFTTMLEIYQIIPKIRKSVHSSSILLLEEICKLASLCMVHNKSLLDRIARESHIIHALISFLDVDLFENISKPIKHGCWPNVLKLLGRLATSSIGFQTICETFCTESDYTENTITLFFYGLSDKDMNVPFLRFITEMMILSQKTDNEFVTFAQLLNGIPLSANIKESTKKFIFNTDIISQSIVNWLEGPDADLSDGPYVAEVLYKQISELFERFSDDSIIKQSLVGGNQDKCFESTCEAVQTLLKCSDKARKLATDESFVFSIVEQMEKIHTSVGGSLTDFVRKFGNAKAAKYIKKLKLLLHIVLCWFSADCLKDVDCIHSLLSVCQKFWSSIGIDAELHSIYMQTLSFVSSNSIAVCRALASIPQFTVGTQPFLGSIIEYAIAETGKPKTAQANLEMLKLAISIITNSCCCVEGRLFIKKGRMYQIFDRLHPHVTRDQKPWPQITHFWLSSFEVYTRSEEVSKAAHLHFLCNLAKSSHGRNRRLALEILRNMSFNPENRATLLGSDDFFSVMYSVLDQNRLGDDQCLITVSIWKLVANYSKGKNIIKNSPILGKLRELRETVERYSVENRIKSHAQSNGKNGSSSGADHTPQELAVVLNIVLKILLS